MLWLYIALGISVAFNIGLSILYVKNARLTQFERDELTEYRLNYG